jgi:GntR family transcriptional regulator/MocR family aminotransferase
MDLHVSLAGPGDLADRIYRQLLDAILDGRLRAGERLPPTREFARRLTVSRNTVTAAYDRLTADGFLVSRVGAGTFVCNEPVNRYRSRTAPRGGIRPRPLWRAIELPEADRATPRYDFRVGVPDPRLFPLQTWRRLVARELRPETTELAASPDPAGEAGLRAAIARYVGVSRSVRAAPDDVLVTQGAQQALDLIGRVLIEPGVCVAVEEPGYQHARLLFCSLGARVVGVPVDAEGIEVSAIPAAARMVYTTPSHQFPLGTPMSLARRAALLEWAERHRAAIIEDDYDTEFRFSDRPLEPLQSLDRSGHVLYVGSFSKTMLPMLRVGFLVAPASLQAALSNAKQLADRHGESPTQAALARFIDDGHLARHVRVATRRYAARRDQIAETLASDFARWLDVVPSSAGLHLCARVAAGVSLDVDAVLARARLAGIKLESLASFCAESPAQPGLVIGYGAIEAQRIGPGLRRLAAIVGSLAP